MSQEMVKTGYLTKSPPQSSTSISFKNWRRRWFVLLDSSKAFPLAPRQVRLEYYTDETSASHCEKPKGVIDLRDCSGVVASAKEIRGHKNVFNVVTKRRCYHLSADTVADKEKWVFELQRIVNDCKSQQRYGMSTNQFTAAAGSSSSSDDIVLATPKLISLSGPDRDRSQRRTKSDEPISSYGSPSAGSTSSHSMTYEEDWDSDDETRGPASVQSMSVLSDDGAASPRNPGTPAHTFGRNQSPRFSGIHTEPVRFGAGELEDDIPDYKNFGDGVEDGIHDYYDYTQNETADETEDGINDYDETEDGIQEYANLDQTGQHMKDTDDGMFDYADVQFTPTPVSKGNPHRSSYPGSGSFGGQTEGYVNLGITDTDTRTASGSNGVRSQRASSSSGITRSSRQRSLASSDRDVDPLLTMQMPGTLQAFGLDENDRNPHDPDATLKAPSAGYMNLADMAFSQRTTSYNDVSNIKPTVPRKMNRGNSTPAIVASTSTSTTSTTSTTSRPLPASGRPRPPPSKPAVPTKRPGNGAVGQGSPHRSSPSPPPHRTSPSPVKRGPHPPVPAPHAKPTVAARPSR